MRSGVLALIIAHRFNSPPGLGELLFRDPLLPAVPDDGGKPAKNQRDQDQQNAFAVAPPLA